jgi:hypothetical protein
VWKVAVGLLLLALLLPAIWIGHGLATGIAVPYPDPTPEQVAYERYHRGINQLLFLTAGAAWLAIVIGAAVYVGRGLWRGGHG